MCTYATVRRFSIGKEIYTKLPNYIFTYVIVTTSSGCPMEKINKNRPKNCRLSGHLCSLISIYLHDRQQVDTPQLAPQVKSTGNTKLTIFALDNNNILLNLTSYVHTFYSHLILLIIKMLYNILIVDFLFPLLWP